MAGARVLVVGGGVIGTMIAYFAIEDGCDVVQLERELGARGASVRNFGLIWVSGRRVGAELELALHSRRLWERVAADVPGVGFRANGSLTIVQSEAELAVLRDAVVRADARDRGFSLLDRTDVRELNPAVRGDIVAGLHCRHDAAVEPRLVPDALRTRLLSNPRFSWLPGRHVVAVEAGRVRDHLGDVHEGDVAFVCPGAAHCALAGWSGTDAPLRRVRLQMLETEPFPTAVTTSLADGNSLRYYPAFEVPAAAALPTADPLVERHGLQLLLQQRLDGSLTIGDTHDSDEPFDVAVSDEPYEYLLDRAASILGVRPPRVRRRWAGVYSQVTDDRLFHCEEVADRSWVVTGAGGRGMTLAPAIAERVLAEAQITTAASAAR